MLGIPRVFWALLLAGLVLRLIVVGMRPPETLERAPDEREYLEIAQNLAHGNGFALDGQPTGYRDMLYPTVASLVLRVFGDSPKPVLYLQVLLSTLTGLFLFLKGRVRFGERGALILGSLWLFYPSAILASSLFLTVTLFIFLVTGSLLLFDLLESAGFRIEQAVLLGVALGLLILTRAAAGTSIALAFIGYLTFIRESVFARAQWRNALAVIITALIVLTPWMLRNALVLGHFTLNTNSGFRLMMNSGIPAMPRPSSEFQGIQPPEIIGLGDVRSDSLAVRLHFPELSDRPAPLPELWSREFSRLWLTDMSLWVHYLLPDEPAVVIERLRHLPIVLLFLVGLPSVLLVCFGLAGLFTAQHFPTRGLHLLQLLFLTMLLLLVYGLPRDHFPFMPALMVGTASLVQPRSFSVSNWRKFLLLVSLLLFAGIWIYSGVYLLR